MYDTKEGKKVGQLCPSSKHNKYSFSLCDFPTYLLISKIKVN